MKKMLLTLFAVSSFSLANAQNETVQVPDSQVPHRAINPSDTYLPLVPDQNGFPVTMDKLYPIKPKLKNLKSSFESTLLDSTYQYNWDTVTAKYKPYFKTRYFYNIHGSQTSYIQSLYENNTWQNTDKAEYQKNKLGYDTATIISKWSKTKKSFINQNRYQYKYNQFNYQVEYTLSNFDTISNQWVYLNKSINLYDSTRYMGYEYYIWNKTDKTWDGNYRSAYIYTKNSNTGAEYFSWSKLTKSWDKSTRYNYTRDYLNRDSIYIYEIWRKSIKNYYISDITNYFYNKGNTSYNLDSTYSSRYDTIKSVFYPLTATKKYLTYRKSDSLVFQYNYDQSANKWNYSAKQVFTYNSSGAQTSYKYYYWNSTKKVFELNYDYEYSYNKMNQQTFYGYKSYNNGILNYSYAYDYSYNDKGYNLGYSYYSGYDTVAKSWIGNSKVVYVKDYKNRDSITFNYTWEAKTKTFVYSEKNEKVFNKDNYNIISIKRKYNMTKAKFVNQDSTYNFYNKKMLETISTAIKNESPNSNKNAISYIYPNPAKDLVSVAESSEIESIGIYTLDGSLLIKLAVKPGESINITNLSKGVYIVNGTTKDGKIITQKLVKQ